MSEVPTLAEEIDRKAITELQRVMQALMSRRIGVIAACASLQTLWETTSGLVPTETAKLIGESATSVQRALLSKDRPEEVAVFVGPKAFATIQRLLERVVVSMGTPQAADHIASKTLVPPVDELNPASWCVEKFKSTCESLGKSMNRVL